MTTTPVFAHPSERILRPRAEDLVTAWRELFEANAEQEARLRETEASADYWAPGRRDSPIYHVNLDDIWPATLALRALTEPDDTWLDVGAGSGGTAIYLSQFVRRVLAVDPSPGMTMLLRAHVTDYDADRVEVLDADSWPPSRPIEEVDVCVTEHVTYFVADISGFLCALEAHARRLCVVVANERGTGWRPVESLFQALHGEPFVSLTGAPELLAVLCAQGRSVQMLTLPIGQREPEDLDAVHARVRDDYYLRPGSEKDSRLRELIQQEFGVGDGQVRMPPAPGSYTAVISWSPPVS